MAAWAGFSEEELKRVKKIKRPHAVPGHNSTDSNAMKAAFGLEHGQKHLNPSRYVVGTKREVVDSKMKLQKGVAPETRENMQTATHKQPKEKLIDTLPVNCSLEVQNIKTELITQPQPVKVEVEVLNEQEALSRDMMSLEKFREQQNVIEEANKWKKALLAKKLSERKKLAIQEAHKLEHIQKELLKLDHLLTADVQVIRNKIEEASRDFMEAQKRFEKAETEYIASKMDLHVKSELKEQLTEHLYTIIHQNEVRKAKKLADLMSELEMECSEEELHLPELPPLTSFQPTNVLFAPLGAKSFSKRSKSQDDSAGIINVSNTQIIPGSIEGAVMSDNSNNALASEVSDKTAQNVMTTEQIVNEIIENPSVCASENIEKQASDMEHCDRSKVVEAVLCTVNDQINCDNNASDDVCTDSVPPVLIDNIMLNQDQSHNMSVKSKWDFDGSLS